MSPRSRDHLSPSLFPFYHMIPVHNNSPGSKLPGLKPFSKAIFHFMAALVKPLRMCFWKIANTMNTGMMDISTPAMIW